MVAATITTRTILDEIKLILNIETNQFMTDAELTSFVLSHLNSSVGLYKFEKRGDYFWTYTIGSRKFWLYGGTFTGEEDCTYTYNPNGTIICTVGTPTATTITVTGTPVDFTECVLSICEYLLMHKAKEPVNNVGGASYTPPDETRIRSVMETLRGVTSF